MLLYTTSGDQKTAVIIFKVGNSGKAPQAPTCQENTVVPIRKQKSASVPNFVHFASVVLLIADRRPSIEKRSKSISSLGQVDVTEEANRHHINYGSFQLRKNPSMTCLCILTSPKVASMEHLN